MGNDKMIKNIPGINAKAATDLPVLLPADESRMRVHDPVGFSRWLAALPLWIWPVFAAVIMLWPTLALAQSNYTYTQAFQALFKWMPFLVTSGFLFNVIISILTMAIGTVAGVILGLGQISINPAIRWISKFATQTFPWRFLKLIVCPSVLVSSKDGTGHRVGSGCFGLKIVFWATTKPIPIKKMI